MPSTEVRAVRTALTPRTIALRYTAFAIIAGAANLIAQQAVVVLLPTAPLMLSVLVGTVVGFVVKYALDKRWIFMDAYESHASETRKVFIYGLFSVLTTLLFWGTELTFWHIWQTPLAKYTGAVIGLTVGNWIKYNLDKRWVFRRGSE